MSPDKPIIDAKNVIDDIRAGMSDRALMDKYRLSVKGLHSLFDKLLETGFLGEHELRDRPGASTAHSTKISGNGGDDVVTAVRQEFLRRLRANPSPEALLSGAVGTGIVPSQSAVGLDRMVLTHEDLAQRAQPFHDVIIVGEPIAADRKLNTAQPLQSGASVKSVEPVQTTEPGRIGDSSEAGEVDRTPESGEPAESAPVTEHAQTGESAECPYCGGLDPDHCEICPHCGKASAACPEVPTSEDPVDEKSLEEVVYVDDDGIPEEPPRQFPEVPAAPVEQPLSAMSPKIRPHDFSEDMTAETVETSFTEELFGFALRGVVAVLAGLAAAKAVAGDIDAGMVWAFIVAAAVLGVLWAVGSFVRLGIAHYAVMMVVAVGALVLLPDRLPSSGTNAAIVRHTGPVPSDEVIAKNERLLEAAAAGNTAEVKKLLADGAALNGMDRDGATPLMKAINGGHIELAAFLSAQGADVKIKDASGNTPLILACRYGDESLVRRLLGREPELNAKNLNGESPLTVACTEGHASIANLLIRRGANPGIRNGKGEPPLLIAAENGREAVVRLLLKHGADPNSVGKGFGRTPLIVASAGGHASTVALLLEQGANPNIQDSDGETALFAAGRNGHPEITAMLLKAGADPFIRDKAGTSAVLGAAGRSRELLLDAGAPEE